MTITAAYDLVDYMFRGTRYIFKHQVFDDTTEEAYNVANVTAKLRLAHTNTDENSILELTGTVAVAAEGKLEFLFLPEHTENLVAKAYDMTITITSPEGDPWVTLSGRFGIYARSPEVAT